LTNDDENNGSVDKTAYHWTAQDVDDPAELKDP
jgi:hypothetical protein